MRGSEEGKTPVANESLGGAGFFFVAPAVRRGTFFWDFRRAPPGGCAALRRIPPKTPHGALHLAAQRALYVFCAPCNPANGARFSGAVCSPLLNNLHVA